jgi:hypothetical protein
MRGRSAGRATSMLVALAVAGWIGAAPARAVGWTVVPTPNVGTDINELQGISGISATDAWAVGFFRSDGIYQTLTEHWDGAAWSIVASPNSGGSGSFLTGVDALSASDVWAVGRGPSALAEHWNGAAWSVVASPAPTGTTAALNAVAAVSPNDVWAVGSSQGSSFETHTLIEHWDGASWTIVPSPDPDTQQNRLLGVSAIGMSDVWAVGSFGVEDQTLIEHWNGASWTIVPSPAPGTGDNGLNGVVALSARNAWAVGFRAEGTKTLIEHWHRGHWSDIASSNPDDPTANDELMGVSAVSRTNVWAVGLSSNGHTVTEQWNGTAWSVVPSPNPSPIRNGLFGTEALRDGTVWAVGGRARPLSAGGQDRTLVLHTNA